MTLRSYDRSCALHYTHVLKQYSLLMNLRKALLIRNLFSSSDSFTLLRPSDVPKFSCSKQVYHKEIRILIVMSSTKSCWLDPWFVRPTFIVKEYISHHYHQLGSLVSFFIPMFHSLAMLWRSTRLAMLMSGILRDSEDI